MNAYYEKSSLTGSKNDIFEQYFYGGQKATSGWKKYVDRISALLAALVSILSNIHARGMFRIGGVAICLIGVIGLIGAMESGTVSLFAGIALGILLLGIEWLCLHPHQK